MTNEKKTNEEKARDIGKDWYNAECFGVAMDSDIVAEQAALEMAEWKDEQFLQWLKENLAKETFTMFTSKSQGVINFEPVIKAFEKFIKQ